MTPLVCGVVDEVCGGWVAVGSWNGAGDTEGTRGMETEWGSGRSRAGAVVARWEGMTLWAQPIPSTPRSTTTRLN